MKFKDKFNLILNKTKNGTKKYLVSKKNNIFVNAIDFKSKYLVWPPKIRIKNNVQKFAGGMMTTVILLVIVGFFVGMGVGFTELTSKGSFMNVVWRSFTTVGFKIMSYLPLWFCVGLAFSIAKSEKGWAAFCALFVFFAINGLINLYGSVREDIPKNIGSSQVLWKNIAGITTYNTGIFLGIIIGLWVALVHNNSYKKQLPLAFSFFGGARWPIIKMAFYVIPFAAIFYFAWPPINYAITYIGRGIGKLGVGGSFLFGAIDKTLLPLGLHHLIAFPIEYTDVGGIVNVPGIPLAEAKDGWQIVPGTNQILADGTEVATVAVGGVRNIILMQAASKISTGFITHNFTSGRILFQIGGYAGIATALTLVAKKENRKQIASIAIPAALTAAFVGISEPIEYTFLFTAPLLYFLIHVPLAGLAYVLAEITNVSINGHALFFMIPNLVQPKKVHAMSLLWLVPLYYVLYLGSFYITIKTFNIKTPGRGGTNDKMKLFTKTDYEVKKATTITKQQITQKTKLENAIILAFGGADNIISCENCATRLRVLVKDPSKVKQKEYWTRNLQAQGVVSSKKSGTYQIIYGTKVMNIATNIREKLGFK